MNTKINHEYIETNNITLHVVTAGNPDNELVILLHGFPEYWGAWKNQIDDLVNEGYYLMVPDMRGYNLSDKPRGKKSYTIDKIAKDIIGLIDHAGKETCKMVSHDWGAFIHWGILLLGFRNRISNSIIMNVPHPRAFSKLLATDEDQQKRSSYIKRFQLPFIPEYTLKKKNYKVLIGIMKAHTPKGTFTDEDLTSYLQVWSQKRALTSMLNYYRSLRTKIDYISKRVEGNVLIIWGKNDKALKKELAEMSLEYCDNGKLEFIDAGHFVQHEAPNIVNPLVIKHFKN